MFVSRLLLYTYHVYYRVCLSPNRMSNWMEAAQCSMDSSYSAVEILLLCILFQNGWHHDPRDFFLAYKTLVVPVGFIVQYTVQVCVQFLDFYVNYCDCHCCL